MLDRIHVPFDNSHHDQRSAQGIAAGRPLAWGFQHTHSSPFQEGRARCVLQTGPPRLGVSESSSYSRNVASQEARCRDGKYNTVSLTARLAGFDVDTGIGTVKRQGLITDIMSWRRRYHSSSNAEKNNNQMMLYRISCLLRREAILEITNVGEEVVND